MKIDPRGIRQALAAHQKSEAHRRLMKILNEAVKRGIGTLQFDEQPDGIHVKAIQAQDGTVTRLDKWSKDTAHLLFEVARDMANIAYQKGLVLWHQSNRLQMGVFGFQPVEAPPDATHEKKAEHVPVAVRVMVVFIRTSDAELKLSMSLETVRLGMEWFWPESQHVCA